MILWWRLAFVMASGRVSWFRGPSTWSWSERPEGSMHFESAEAAAEEARRQADLRNPAGLFVVPFQGMDEDAARVGWRPWREVLGCG